MVAQVAEPEIYTGRVPSTYADRMRERRRLDAVASDLIASSRRVEVPDGVFTVVNAKFLGELLDVCHATGERLFVVVDEFHLARIAQVAGLTEKTPPKEDFGQASPGVVRAEDVKAVRKWKGWTVKAMALEFGGAKPPSTTGSTATTSPGVRTGSGSPI